MAQIKKLILSGSGKRDIGSLDVPFLNTYEKALERFLHGDFKSGLASAAFSKGNDYRDGKGVRRDIEKAYFYYLQADCAIRKRVKECSVRGDIELFNDIQKALEEARQKYTEKSFGKNRENKNEIGHNKVYETGREEANEAGRETGQMTSRNRHKMFKFTDPEWIRQALSGSTFNRLKIEELKGGMLSVDISPKKRVFDPETQMMLITIPQADYCELKKQLHLETALGSSYKIYEDHYEDRTGYSIGKVKEHDSGNRSEHTYGDESRLGSGNRTGHSYGDLTVRVSGNRSEHSYGDEIDIYYDNKSMLSYDDQSEIIFDSIEYDAASHKTRFYWNDRLVAEIKTDFYTFKALSRDEARLAGELLRLVSVVFFEGGKWYDYICDDTSVTKGDFVTVNSRDGLRAVKVMAVNDTYKNELKLPFYKYQRVVGKA